MGIPFGKLMWFLGTALAGYLGICVLAFVFQRSLLYFPIRWTEGEARRANPGYEEVWIATSDGERLHAWLHRRADSPWTVVVFHGNAGNLRYHEPALALFRQAELQAVLFDYRGYGLSTGSPTQEGLLKDGEAVAEFVEKTLGVPRERLVYFGQSLGSGVAVLLAEKRSPARLILESAYPSLAAVAAHHYPFLPAGLLMRDRFESGKAIQQVSCPVLFLHPELDEIIPISLGRALFDRTRAPKTFFSIPGARHNDAFDVAPEEHLSAIRDFLPGAIAPGEPSSSRR